MCILIGLIIGYWLLCLTLTATARTDTFGAINAERLCVLLADIDYSWILDFDNSFCILFLLDTTIFIANCIRHI